MKILIVDDEKLIREELKTILLRSPFLFENIFEAQTCEEALSIFNAHDIKIVITDIYMPDINGLSLAEKLKEKSSDVQIIILSGFSDFGYAKQAIHLGVLDYILKPFSCEELYKSLSNAIKNINSIFMCRYKCLYFNNLNFFCQE